MIALGFLGLDTEGKTGGSRPVRDRLAMHHIDRCCDVIYLSHEYESLELNAIALARCANRPLPR